MLASSGSSSLNKLVIRGASPLGSSFGILLGPGASFLLLILNLPLFSRNMSSPLRIASSALRPLFAISARMFSKSLLCEAWRAVTSLETDRQIERQTDRQIDTQIHKQRDRQTDRQTNRQTDIQTNRETDILRETKLIKATTLIVLREMTSGMNTY